jgi:glycerate kinase
MADLVITAEGQIDAQTAYGKSVGSVASMAKRYDLPVLALAGGLGDNYQVVYELGVDAVEALPSSPMTLVYAMENAARLISDAAERACRLLQVGANIRGL